MAKRLADSLRPTFMATTGIFFFARLGQRRDEPIGVARLFHEKGDHPGRGHLKGIVDVVGRCAIDFLTAGDDQIAAVAEIVEPDLAEDRTRMGDEGDMATLDHLVGGVIDRDRNAVGHVEIAHAVTATDRHVCLARLDLQARKQTAICFTVEVTGIEDGGRANTHGNRVIKLLFQIAAVDAKDRHVDRLGQVTQGG